MRRILPLDPSKIKLGFRDLSNYRNIKTHKKIIFYVNSDANL